MIDSNVPLWLSWLRRLCLTVGMRGIRQRWLYNDGYCETGDVCVELVMLVPAEFTVQLYPDYTADFRTVLFKFPIKVVC